MLQSVGAQRIEHDLETERKTKVATLRRKIKKWNLRSGDVMPNLSNCAYK